MKWLNGYRMRMVLIGVVAALVLVDGASARADFVFGEPTNLGPTVNSSADDMQPTISADGLSLFFHSLRSGGSGGADLWVTKRLTVSDPWTTPVNLGALVNSSVEDRSPSISADALELYFNSNRPGGHGSDDIWMTTRPTTSDSWGPPVNLGSMINSSVSDRSSEISADGLALFFGSWRPGGSGGQDIWVTTRATKNADWSAQINLGQEVNSSAGESAPSISADGLWIFLKCSRPGGYGGADIWMTARQTSERNPEGYWGTPINLGPTVNTPYSEHGPDISADGSTLYFMSGRPGGLGDYDIWQVSLEPIVDLNGDGVVDVVDMCIIVDHWGTDNSLCDIGPMPWGDGIVDVQDLIVLAEHLFENVDDPRLIAHWPLDETEGMTAGDVVGNNDGFAIGGPSWLPTDGMVDGAVELDGVDDFVSTPAVVNPADGPFSLFAWIGGGAPGQVIVAQQAISDWLCLDAEGRLMTNIKCGGRSAGPLLSEAVITDGQWHRVGLVWDGSKRTLVVDGVAVAEDIQTTLESSDRGLYIGVGADFSGDSFFSGLIDDVRIYNRIVSP